MRVLWNNLSDPSLHLLAIALILAYLAFGSRPSTDEVATAPLAYCGRCHAHFMPEKACDCRLPERIAHSLP